MLKEKANFNFLNYLTFNSQTGMIIILILLILGIGKVIDKLTAFLAPAVPKITISTVIIDRIRGVKELTTAVFVMEAIVPTSQANKIGGFVIGETKLLYIAHGEVKAGINLEKLTDEAIKINGDSLQINLPSPEILDSKIDVDKSRVYDYDRGFLGLGPDVAPQLQTLAQKETLKKILDAACQKGILQEANQKAALALTQLFLTSGYEKVKVITTKPENCHI
jgi:Protein of unknown function (DUF4230)